MSVLGRKYLDLINSPTAARADFDEFFAPEYVEHSGSAQVLEGAESQYQMYQMTHTAFPDIHFEGNMEVHQPTPEGELWALYWTMTGTHEGEFMGIPPTGNQVKISGISIWKIVDGKNVEEWEIGDSMSLMQQLGVIPSPG